MEYTGLVSRVSVDLPEEVNPSAVGEDGVKGAFRRGGCKVEGYFGGQFMEEVAGTISLGARLCAIGHDPAVGVGETVDRLEANGPGNGLDLYGVKDGIQNSESRLLVPAGKYFLNRPAVSGVLREQFKIRIILQLV